MKISPYKNPNFEIPTTCKWISSRDLESRASVTGRGADILILDDPLKPIDALSDAKRERVNDTFNHTLRSRLNDQRTGAIIVAGAASSDDLTGSLLRDSPEEWTVLSLPAIATQEQIIRIGDGKDDYHVRRVGDLLHAERQTQD